ncbi:MAG: spore protease YyaC [Clostridiales bacterium]|nr:spore protease YyaC [Clostridiales bacterium]
MTKNIYYIDVMSENAVERFGDIFLNKIQGNLDEYRHLIILCIGTDRATGDSLGPITGHKLVSTVNSGMVSILGTLEKPVHAKNIRQTLDYIEAAYEDPFIAAIDACLGKPESVGYITIGEGPVNPGAGLSKALPTVGNVSITGIVNVATGMDFAVLQNTRLHLVMKMAEVIHDGINLGLENYQKSCSRLNKNIV